MRRIIPPLLIASLVGLGRAAAQEEPQPERVATRALEGRFTLEVTRSDVGRELPARVTLDAPGAGLVRLEVDGRRFILHRIGKELVGRLPASLGLTDALPDATPRTTVTLRLKIRGADLLEGTIRNGAERTALRLVRAPIEEDGSQKAPVCPTDNGYPDPE